MSVVLPAPRRLGTLLEAMDLRPGYVLSGGFDDALVIEALTLDGPTPLALLCVGGVGR